MNENDDAFDDGKQALRDIKETLKAGGADVAEEARAAAGDVRSAAADVASTAHDTSTRVKGHATAAAGSAKVALSDAAETASAAAEELIEDQRDTLRDWQARAEHYVRNEPVHAMGLAAIAGLVVGLWLRGSRH